MSTGIYTSEWMWIWSYVGPTRPNLTLSRLQADIIYAPAVTLDFQYVATCVPKPGRLKGDRGRKSRPNFASFKFL